MSAMQWTQQEGGPATTAVPKYKLARKPVPQYVDVSPPVLHRLPLTMNEDPRGPSPDPSYSQPRVAPPSTNSRFRIFSSLDEAKITKIRYSAHSDTFYPPNMGRVTTGTQDLAEFFKESGPGDFKRPSEENTTTNRTPGASKKSRFLKIQTFKDSSEKTQSQAPPPASIPHVVSKTTAMGKPYLQIHVDYVPPQRPGSESPVELAATSYNPTRALPKLTAQEQNASIPIANSRKTSSPTGFDHRKFRPYPPQSGRQTPVSNTGSPKPTGSPQVNDHYTRTLSPSFDGSDRQDRSSVGSADGAASYYSPSTQRSSLSNTHRHSNTPEPSTRSTIPAEATNETQENVYQAIAESPRPSHHPYLQMRAPPRPGPPPNRGLPSLPESTDSIASSMYPSPALSPAQSESSTLAAERQRREERVKARKARDMKEMHQRKIQLEDRRLSNPSSISLASSTTNSVAYHSESTSPTTSANMTAKGLRPASASPEMLLQGSTLGDITSMERIGLAQPNQIPTLATTTTTSMTSGESQNLNNLNPSNRPRQPSTSTTMSASTSTPPRSPGLPSTLGVAGLAAPPATRKTKKSRSATLSSRADGTRTAKEIELEQRLELLEQKSMILEQALITVLQRTSPHSESNSIENLLASFRITYPCRGWSDTTLPSSMEYRKPSPPLSPSPNHHHHQHFNLHQQQHERQQQLKEEVISIQA